ncbi:hypothetical protein LWP59_27095 [Amycolatopsis acidiphila]|uniref:Uncharacterized protein n=1 Tax=Amycolatopsis acidiphila TaxID=715473 RepID=A0A558AIN9_9PSEU|nr:hypothetical protein [Amycolatopsis acidiphila]TVT24061.1 hypothetical protein FNH06_07585 [Amycolatopsis acidiphila]UIJ57792.1 hypothetical protein LWP59_27095 [Amycolatopsis acidiphila]GHG87720.1 hypothetical protein GCM10017788_61580 [Amycolatopsis acidiphila]
MTADFAVLAVVGTVLLEIGWWGRRAAAGWVSPALPEAERLRRIGKLRGSGYALQVVGVVFALAAVWSIW